MFIYGDGCSIANKEAVRMGHMLVGLALLFVGGSVVYRRAPRDTAELGHLSVPTVIAAVIAYGGNWSVTLLAAWQGVWPLPMPRMVTLLAGAGAVLLGLGTHVTARAQFRSFRQSWGMDVGRLITTGIYRYSRNPQTLGIMLALLGAGLLGNSAAAMLLAMIAWLASATWIRREEGILVEQFGAEYEAYCARTPRWLGPPRKLSR
jgi:protein-S-isoprenylcysteine O-methyltransferase Ste14